MKFALPNNWGLNRREFLRFLSLLGLVPLFTRCERAPQPPKIIRIPLGPLDKFQAGMTTLPMERLVVLRDRRGLAAMSRVCTHQSCLVVAESGGFRCPCHGGVFDSRGGVVSGPPKRSLFWYKLELNENKELVVVWGEEADPEWRLPV